MHLFEIHSDYLSGMSLQKSPSPIPPTRFRSEESYLFTILYDVIHFWKCLKNLPNFKQ